MVFVEFVSLHSPSWGARHYFVGASLKAVLADTDGGKEFGSIKFISHRLITLEDARLLGLGYLDEGIYWVKQGCKSFKLATP